MKNILITVFLGTTIIFGALYLREIKTSNDSKASVSTLQEKVTTLQSSVDTQERRTAAMRQELENTQSKTTASVQEAVRASKKAQASAGGDSTNNNAFSGMMKEISKNPEMREMIKKQQKAMFGPITEKNYGKLFAQLGLSPEQSSGLKELIVNKQLAAADAGMSMFDGDMDATKRAELSKQMKAANDDADAKIKEFLGDANFSQFQSYEKTMADRMAVSGFKDQLDASAPLTDVQEDQLFQAMTQERQNFKFTTDLSDKSKFNGDFSSMLDPDKMNTFFDELSKLNQQYLQRAQGILNTDQLASFQKFLDGQQAMQKMGLQMAAKMFGAKK